MSIKNKGRGALHDWRDFQRIKNELAGPEREAIEIYPRESDLVDTAEQYHVWVLPEDSIVPVGFRDGRMVAEAQVPGHGSQRPFEPGCVPPDLCTDIEDRMQAVADERDHATRREDER